MPLILNRFRVRARSLSPVASGFTNKVNYAEFSTKGRKNNNTSSVASRASNGPQYTLPDSADVVVIGGGSIGCSTLYHLAKLNAGKVVLVEKHRLTSGTTWHTGGLFFHLRNDNEVHIRMQLHTHDSSSRILPEETGQDSGWLETGLITITRRKQQLEELEKRFMLGTQLGVESSIIGPTEIARLHPLLDTQGLAGGLYVPKDGSIDATTLCNAYVKVATKYGAEVYEGCEVKSINTTEGITGQKRVSSIETNLGRINTNCVVNCTGVWAPYIAEMVGLHVPQVTYVHTNVVTEDSADVVVIGGGSIGCSTLYHLAKLNAGKVVLVEKDKLTSGTTWHTGGLFFHLRNDNEVHIRMQLHTHDLLSRILPEETGQNSGWLGTGLITITRRKQQLEELEKRFMLGTQFGVGSSIIGPTEIARLHPLLDTEGLAGGLYVPKDGSIDATTLCNAYVKVATKYGAEVYEGCEVKSINTTEGITGQKRVTSIETNLGRINTNCVVNCTGVWAPYIAEMVGLHVPQVTYVHTNVVTEGVPGIKNTPHIKDVEGSCYLKRQGDALLIGGDDTEPAAIEKIEKDFAFSLYDVDWERAGRLLRAASSLMPEVAKVGITSTVCGPEAYNMDGNPIMGESPSIRGFFHACGFSGGGMMLGGGAGQQLAHWIVHGSPEYDLSCCDINRFSSKLIRHRPWVLETTHEHFTQRYSVHHPNLKNLSGRGLRKSPLHEFHLKNGAFFTCVHGWEVPEYFKPGREFPLLEYDYKGSYGHKIHKEYEYRDQMLKECDFQFQREIDELVKSEALLTTQSAAVFDLSHLSKFRLNGKFAKEAVRVLFPEDLTTLGKNQSKFSLMLGNDGTIVSQVIITKENESKYSFIAPAQQQEFVLRHMAFCLDDLKILCKFEDMTETYALLHLQGDGSSKVLQTIFPDISNLDKICCYKVSISGRDVSISKCPLSGFNILCNKDDAMAVYQALINSNPRPMIAGTRALKSLSMEAGQDFLLDAGPAGLDPREADLTQMCCFDGAREYIGKNALLQRLGQPLTFKLVGLTADTKDPICPGDVIWRNSIYCGTIKDASYGYNRKKFFIQGFVHAPTGETLTEDYMTSGKYTVGRPSCQVEATLILNTTLK